MVNEGVLRIPSILSRRRLADDRPHDMGRINRLGNLNILKCPNPLAKPLAIDPVDQQATIAHHHLTASAVRPPVDSQ